MNGGETSNASFTPKPSETTLPQTTVEQEPSVQTTQEPKKGVIDTVKGWFNKGNKETVPQSDTTTTQEPSQSQTTSYLPETMGDKEQALYQNVASNNVDSDTKLQEQGQGKKEAIENVIPRYNKKTWVGLMSDPNLSWDQKAELVLDALASGGKALTSGQVQQTDKRAINDAITQQYAQNIADRDKRAMNAQIEPLEALNKQQTDVELRLRDTPVSAYIDRYNAEQSAETKKQVLEALIKDKGTWSRLDERQKMDTLSYIQALDGNGSLLGMALQEFGPDVLKWLKSMTKGNGENVSGEETPGGETPSGNFILPPDRKLTDAELEADQKLEEKKRNYVVIPGVGGKPPLVVRKGDRVWQADSETKERELAVNAILENYNLSPEEKIRYARLCDGEIPGENLGSMGLIELAVRRGIKNTPSTDVPSSDQKQEKPMRRQYRQK